LCARSIPNALFASVLIFFPHPHPEPP
jgi:hypothetical protein